MLCKAMENVFVLGSLKLDRILVELSSGGAAFLRILKGDFRIALLREAEGYERVSHCQA